MTKLIVPDTVWWVRDGGCVQVVDETRGANHTLTGVEAAVWDGLMLGYRDARLTAWLAGLLSLSTADAAAALTTTLQTWAQAGLLREVTDG